MAGSEASARQTGERERKKPVRAAADVFLHHPLRYVVVVVEMFVVGKEYRSYHVKVV